MRDDDEGTRSALEAALGDADVVCVSGGVSVGPHDHVKPALRGAGCGGALLARGAATRQADLVRLTRRHASCSGCPGNPVSAMVTFHLFARPALRRCSRGRHPTTACARGAGPRCRGTPARDEAVRSGSAPRTTAGTWSPTGPQGSHVLSSMIGAGALALVEAGEGEDARVSAPVELLTAFRVRQRDPRRLLARSRAAKARVQIIDQPEAELAPGRKRGSKQVADVTVPGDELDRIWKPEYLERLAATYWRFLTRVSLGILRVVYTPHSREIVALARPFVLLRFQAPEYEIGRLRQRHVAHRPGIPGRPRRAGARASCASRSSAPRPRPGPRRRRVSSEVVNFYPLLAGWGWFSRSAATSTRRRSSRSTWW